MAQSPMSAPLFHLHLPSAHTYGLMEFPCGQLPEEGRTRPGPTLELDPKLVLTAEANCRSSQSTHGSREEDKSKGKKTLVGSAASNTCGWWRNWIEDGGNQARYRSKTGLSHHHPLDPLMDFVLPVTATLGFDRSEALVQGMEEWWSGRGFSLNEHNSLLNLKEELSPGHFWTTNASEPVG